MVFDLATGPSSPATKTPCFSAHPAPASHLAQAIGQAAIQQGYRVLYRETHALLDDLAEATLDGTRKEHMEFLEQVKLPFQNVPHGSPVHSRRFHGHVGDSQTSQPVRAAQNLRSGGPELV
jgi:hypothetical protein